MITAVVNVADDTVLHGLHVSPDLDTITYTLADEIDPERGWGLRDETWQAMATLGRYGDGDWFSLGDRDLGTHLHRTGRLASGADLTTVTGEIATAWGIEVTILPVSEDRISTRLTRADDGSDVPFQEYFVRHRHGIEIAAVHIDGAADAEPTPAVVEALAADVVIVAPSNPVVSIEPILAVAGVRELLADRPGPTVAISPIVAGAALKGPAARLMAELGEEPSVVGVARRYAEVIDGLVIDQADAGLARQVAAVGPVPIVTDTIMGDQERAAGLARTTLAASSSVGGRRG